MSITFDTTIEASGTCLQGYYYVDPSYRQFISQREMYNKSYNEFLDKYGFDKIVNVLKANYPYNRNCDKSTFDFTGKYKNDKMSQPIIFTLYDYKSDECIHIGGEANFPVMNFIEDLHKLMINLL